MLQKGWQLIVPPCVRAFLAVYRPIASLCKKIVQLCVKLIAILKSPLLAILRILRQSVGLFKPLFRIFHKKHASDQTFFQKCKYGMKVAFIWVKLLIGYGFNQAKEQVKAKSIVSTNLINRPKQ